MNNTEEAVIECKSMTDVINVLLVDHNAIDNFIHLQNFKRYGNFKCNVFQSASAALSHLQEASSIYDFIFVDIYMPGMDGFTFIEHYNKLVQNTIHSRLIILTASLIPADKARANNLGVQFMQKPFQIENFLKSV